VNDTRQARADNATDLARAVLGATFDRNEEFRAIALRLLLGDLERQQFCDLAVAQAGLTAAVIIECARELHMPTEELWQRLLLAMANQEVA
jgi:hypothetical protein